MFRFSNEPGIQPKISHLDKPMSDIKLELHPQKPFSDQIKKVFDKEYKSPQSQRPKFLDSIFYTSNDHVTYWDIPRLRRVAHKNSVSTFLEKNKTLNPINLLVAECDYISWSMENVPGDIIIMDINKALLQFIENQHKFLKNLYAMFCSNLKTFDQVKEAINEFQALEDDNLPHYFEARKKILGNHHWLFDKETYKKSMESLIHRNVVTLNINLFNRKETNTLVNLLQKNHCIVPFVNLTNLPDYDEKNELSLFLKKLPFAHHSHAQLIMSNIHDRGMYSHTLYDHYLNYTTSVEEYDHYYQRAMPKYFAIKDFYNFLNNNATLQSGIDKNGKIIKYGWSITLAQNEKRYNHKIHNICLDIFRDEYIKIFKEYEDKFYTFCQQPENKDKTISDLSRNFTNQLKPLYEDPGFFHVDSIHYKEIRNILTFCDLNSIALNSQMLDLLKVDKELTESISHLLSWSTSPQDMSFADLNWMVEHAYIVNIIKILNPETDSKMAATRKKSLLDFLAATKGSECVFLINHTINSSQSTSEKDSTLYEKNLEKKLISFIGPFVQESKPIENIKEECEIKKSAVDSSTVAKNGFFSRITQVLSPILSLGNIDALYNRLG